MPIAQNTKRPLERKTSWKPQCFLLKKWQNSVASGLRQRYGTISVTESTSVRTFAVIDSTRSRLRLLRDPERAFLTIEPLMYADRVLNLR
jgi:hypothetical protein